MVAPAPDRPISGPPSEPDRQAPATEPGSSPRRPRIPPPWPLAAVLAVALTGGVAAAWLGPSLQPAATEAPALPTTEGPSDQRPGSQPAALHVTPRPTNAPTLDDPTPGETALPPRPSPSRSPRPSGPAIPVTLRVPVLNYHVISPAAITSPSEYAIRPELFDAHLRTLSARGWRTITAADLGKLLASGERPVERTFVITMDDGTEDGLTIALPIMGRYRFVATYYVVPTLVGKAGYLTWDQVRALRGAGMEIGNHSLTHPRMPLLSPADCAREVALAQTVLDGLLGDAPVTFAYPYGAFNPAAVQAVGDAGLLAAFTTQSGTTESWAGRLVIPRIHVGPATTAEQLVRLFDATLR